MATATESFGRGFGFGGHALGISPGFHPGAFRPANSAFAHTARSGFNHRRFGTGLYWPGGVFYGGGYGYESVPAVVAEPVYPPPYAGPDVTGAIPASPYVPRRIYPIAPGCQTQSVTVPAEDGGGERTINIFRC